MQAIISSKGQVTLPKALRDRLHLTTGDRVEFVVDEHGVVRLIPKHESFRALKGVLPRPDRPVSLDEMARAVERGAAGD